MRKKCETCSKELGKKVRKKESKELRRKSRKKQGKDVCKKVAIARKER